MTSAVPQMDDDRGIGVEPAVEVWREGERTVLALRGEHDLATVPHVAAALDGATAFDEGDLVVDLSGVVFMDASVVRVLTGGQRSLERRGRVLSLRAPSAPARRLLGMCELTHLVETADDAGPASVAPVRPSPVPSVSGLGAEHPA